MRELSPKDITDVIALVANTYSEARPLTKEEEDVVNTFFGKYMDKAMESCISGAKKDWMVARATDSVSFKDKVVEVPAEDGTKVEFIVASTAMRYTGNDLEAFRKNFVDLSQEAILKKFSDVHNQEWVTVFNKLAVRADNNPATGQITYLSTLFIGIRFSIDMFEQNEKNPDRNYH
jgi:hypothetical protein